MKKAFQLSLLLLSGALLTLTSCKDDKQSSLPSCEGVHWEYSGDEGPDHWKDLCVDYTSCGGPAQSPIDITGAQDDNTLVAIGEHFVSSTTHAVNNGHTVQFNCDAGSEITVDGQTYKLLQYHFHTHSEHTVGGVAYPMEVHFVHKNETTGKLAVVGVFFKEGAENEFLKPFIEHLPATKDATFDDANLSFNVSDCLPSNRSYYTYGGSLTTPPCSEIVTWLVMQNPVEASHEQIEAFHSVEHDNARPVQALGSRSLKHASL